MESDGIHKLTMPKWGLSMTHGKVVEWLVPEGAEVSAGLEVLEVETDKITGCVEVSAPQLGVSGLAGTLGLLKQRGSRRLSAPASDRVTCLHHSLLRLLGSRTTCFVRGRFFITTPCLFLFGRGCCRSL